MSFLHCKIKQIIVIVMVVGSFGMTPPRSESSPQNGKPLLETPVITVDDNRICVQSQLKNSFSSELQKTINSGKQVSFHFTIELLRSRFSIFYPDEKVWKKNVVHSVTYNTATREFTVELGEENGRELKYTANPEEMMEWINTISLSIPGVIAKKYLDKEHYVRLWATAITSPLPGGFKTKTIYSPKIVPARLLVEEKSP